MMAGPIFIKLGQWMSTRRDLYNDAFINTLSTLTTESKTHSFDESKKQIASLMDLKEFKYIDPYPVGKSSF
jgi:predicted unusual protein kinase regulating ubiquinone biosynthesis (AarF/ABC1/UbiB family)